MKIFTKKRVVLFLLFIFPLICFLILSTGENNFKKLPIITEGVVDIANLNTNKKVQLKDHISIVVFLGDSIQSNKSGLLNLNEKVYKKFIDYKNFQAIAVFPNGKETEALQLKKELGTITNMSKWVFVASSKEEIMGFYDTFSTKEPLNNLLSTKAFLIDKNLNLRGRTTDKDSNNGMLYGYNLNSVSELNAKMKDDVSVLFYEYYAAFKNKNKADRKEVGL